MAPGGAPGGALERWVAPSERHERWMAPGGQDWEGTTEVGIFVLLAGE